MDFAHFSLNGKLVPIGQAAMPLSNIEYQYGFGVYESLRASGGTVHFLADHCERLMESARIIGLEHPFTASFVKEAVTVLAKDAGPGAYNLKMLLIGGPTKESASLYVFCLNPLFPDKKLYKEGAKFVTYEYERAFPHAKTLNMLQSYLAYREAKRAGAFDALLVNKAGCITEGTRTNFFCLKGDAIVTPPEEEILLGVTRKNVLAVARENGFSLAERDIRPSDLSRYDGAFITATSAKIIPVRSVDGHTFTEIPATLRRLTELFDSFLEKHS